MNRELKTLTKVFFYLAMILNLYTLRLDIRQSHSKLESCRKTMVVVYFRHRLILSIGRAENLETHHS